MDPKAVYILLKPTDNLHYMAKGICSYGSLKGLLFLQSNLCGPWVITENVAKENLESHRGERLEQKRTKPERRWPGSSEAEPRVTCHVLVDHP